MPPWAAPVWLRVGESLVSTAVRTRGPASTAARIPAPPAPTITTSYRCCWITGRLSRDVRVEGHQHVGAQQTREPHRQQQQAVEPEPGGILAAVVVDDGAQPFGPVQRPQPQQRHVPDLPERGVPALRDIVEVDAVHAVLPHEHDEQVPKGQENQRDPGKPHEQPRELLEVGNAGAAPRGAGIVQAGGAGVEPRLDRGGLPAAGLKVGAAHRKSSIMWMPSTPAAGTIRSKKTTATIHSISRWWRGPSDQ